MDEHFNILIECSLIRIAARPIVEKRDEINPRVSKFGGVFPYLPKEEYLMHCNECNSNMTSCVQLYVPQLPEYFRNYFPKDKQGCLLVLTICTKCLGLYTYRVSVYDQDELDYLMFSEPNDKEKYNKFETRVVTGWKMIKMTPGSRCHGSKWICINLNNSDTKSFENQTVGEYYTGGTYLGGWPDFVQRDETPIGMSLLLEMEQSESSILMWGDSGTAQLWMSTGDDFGEFKFTWACC